MPSAHSQQPGAEKLVRGLSKAQARPSYGGIAAELTNDGRLWADRWSSQGRMV